MNLAPTTFPVSRACLLVSHKNIASIDEFYSRILDQLCKHISPFADVPCADFAVLDEGVAFDVCFGGFVGGEDRHGAEWFLWVI